MVPSHGASRIEYLPPGPQSSVTAMATHPDKESKRALANAGSALSLTSAGSKTDLSTDANDAATERSQPRQGQDSAHALIFLAFAYAYLFWYTTRSGPTCTQVNPLWLVEQAWVLSLPFSSSLVAMDLVYDTLLSHHAPRSGDSSAASSRRLARRRKWQKIIFVWIGGLKMAVLVTCLLGLDRLLSACR